MQYSDADINCHTAKAYFDPALPFLPPPWPLPRVLQGALDGVEVVGGQVQAELPLDPGDALGGRRLARRQGTPDRLGLGDGVRRPLPPHVLPLPVTGPYRVAVGSLR